MTVIKVSQILYDLYTYVLVLNILPSVEDRFSNVRRRSYTEVDMENIDSGI